MLIHFQAPHSTSGLGEHLMVSGHQDLAISHLLGWLCLAEAYSGSTTVFVDEFDTGHFQGTPILTADKWISDLQFFDYLSLLQVFRIENGTSCAHGCRDDQSIID